MRPRWERCFGPWALQITKTITTLHWRRFRYRSLMRFKGRNVLHVPGVITVHVSTYATSSVRQRHSRGTPPPRWCPPPETSCTSPSANPKTGRGTHLCRGSMSFINALRRAAHCGPSDMEGTLTFPSHQEFLKKSPGAQSYDLERDFTTSGPTLGSTFSAPRGPSQVQQLRKTQSKSITAPPVFAH